MHINLKNVGSEFLVDVMIEKNIIEINSQKARERVPQMVVFLIIVLQGYPQILHGIVKVALSKFWKAFYLF